VAKIEWHPWGERGSTLMVMTEDGKLRYIPRSHLDSIVDHQDSEYDISVDAEEPQQVISFLPQRKTTKRFTAEDEAEREVASFTLGQGRADWGPFTIYVVMKGGDIYSMCPYMPRNA
jgi:nucleoporin NUP82